jgi:iron complex outermembrane receptor protein
LLAGADEDVTSYRAELRWRVLPDWLVEGSYSEEAQLPSVEQLYRQGGFDFPEYLDPCFDGLLPRLPGSYSPDPNDRTVRRCYDGFGGVGPVAPGFDFDNTNHVVLNGGNPLLEPERARERKLVLRGHVPILAGLDMTFGWSSIEIANPIADTTLTALLFRCYYDGDVRSCRYIVRDGSGNIDGSYGGFGISGSWTNSSTRQEAEAWDFALHLEAPAPRGALDIDWHATYLSYLGDADRLAQGRCRVGSPHDARGSPCAEIASGNLAGRYLSSRPAWRLRSNVRTTWRHRNWDVTLGARYMSALDEACLLPIALDRPELCSNPAGSPQNPYGENRIDATWYFDLQGTWDAPWNARVTAGIRNLFDEDPPLAFDAFANTFDPQYEVPGRFWYLAYSQRF